MSAWGTGIYQSDSALDYLGEIENLVVLKMWKDLGIHVDAEQDDNGDWHFTSGYFAIRVPKFFYDRGEIDRRYHNEDMLLVWVDVVLKLGLFVYEEQIYGAYSMLGYCIENIDEYWGDENQTKERLELLEKYQDRITRHMKVYDMFVPSDYGYGIKKENEEWKEERKRQQKQKRKEELEERRQNGEKLGYGKRRETNHDEELDKE